MRANSRDDTRSVMRERERDASDIVSLTLACYTLRGDKYLALLFCSCRTQRLLKDSDFPFFLFFSFFKGISGVNSGIIIISGVREEVFFFFFLFGRTRTTSSLVIFF